MLLELFTSLGNKGQFLQFYRQITRMLEFAKTIQASFNPLIIDLTFPWSQILFIIRNKSGGDSSDSMAK